MKPLLNLNNVGTLVGRVRVNLIAQLDKLVGVITRAILKKIVSAELVSTEEAVQKEEENKT
tara:strand:+ start:152 stop:334 length:183 start_codon:yes stop_codon:yes gene_type:complete